LMEDGQLTLEFKTMSLTNEKENNVTSKVHS